MGKPQKHTHKHIKYNEVEIEQASKEKRRITTSIQDEDEGKTDE